MGGANGLLLIIKNGLTNHENLPPPLRRPTLISYGSKMKDLNWTVVTTGSEVLKLFNMGIEAIKSHESNAKHRDLAAVAVAAASTLSSALGES